MDQDAVCERIFRLCEAFIAEQARSAGQRALLQEAFTQLRRQVASRGDLPFISLPLRVYAAITGRQEEAFPLAAATTLLFVGIDLLDDVADGDLPHLWKDRSPEAQLAAATFLSALPQLAIARLDAPAAVIVEMQRTLASGLLRMSAGQQQDLAAANGLEARSADVERSVEAKSGEELALFARLAALLAEAPDAVVSAYEAMGRAIGTAGQLASDCHDLFQARHSRDLANGTRTFPIARHLERLTPPQRQAFASRLDEARNGGEAARRVRRELIESGALRLASFVIESHCQRALRSLPQGSLEPAAGQLSGMIQDISFFPRKQMVRTGGDHEQRIGGDIDGPLGWRRGVPR